jgi:hypothetical protein
MCEYRTRKTRCVCALFLILYYPPIADAYYALTSMGIRVPWKKAVTVSQIVQFVIDLFVVFFASWNHWAYKSVKLQRFAMGDCSGKEYAAISGMSVLSSYLVLFIICKWHLGMRCKARLRL